MKPSTSNRPAGLLLGLAALASPALACPSEALMEMPWFVEITLAIGYEIDPFRVTVNAGGSNALRDCTLPGDALEGYEGRGYVDMRPDAILHWTGGGPQFAVTAEFDEPTLLLIRDPGGTWHVDEGTQGEGPRVTFENPAIGDYVIFNGVLGEPHATSTGELVIAQTGF